MATLPPNPRRTFGLHRAEILAAMVNAVMLLGVCGYLAFEGTTRLIHPSSVETGPLDEFSGGVASHFDVDHVTFQIEPQSHRDHESLGEAHA